MTIELQKPSILAIRSNLILEGIKKSFSQSVPINIFATGRTNVGKTTLGNRLIGEEYFTVTGRQNTTNEINLVEFPNGLKYFDLPGVDSDDRLENYNRASLGLSQVSGFPQVDKVTLTTFRAGKEPNKRNLTINSYKELDFRPDLVFYIVAPHKQISRGESAYLWDLLETYQNVIYVFNFFVDKKTNKTLINSTNIENVEMVIKQIHTDVLGSKSSPLITRVNCLTGEGIVDLLQASKQVLSKEKGNIFSGLMSYQQERTPNEYSRQVKAELLRLFAYAALQKPNDINTGEQLLQQACYTLYNFLTDLQTTSEMIEIQIQLAHFNVQVTHLKEFLTETTELFKKATELFKGETETMNCLTQEIEQLKNNYYANKNSFRFHQGKVQYRESKTEKQSKKIKKLYKEAKKLSKEFDRVGVSDFAISNQLSLIEQKIEKKSRKERKNQKKSKRHAKKVINFQKLIVQQTEKIKLLEEEKAEISLSLESLQQELAAIGDKVDNYRRAMETILAGYEEKSLFLTDEQVKLYTVELNTFWRETTSSCRLIQICVAKMKINPLVREINRQCTIRHFDETGEFECKGCTYSCYYQSAIILLLTLAHLIVFDKDITTEYHALQQAIFKQVGDLGNFPSINTENNVFKWLNHNVNTLFDASFEDAIKKWLDR